MRDVASRNPSTSSAVEIRAYVDGRTRDMAGDYDLECDLPCPG